MPGSYSPLGDRLEKLRLVEKFPPPRVVRASCDEAADELIGYLEDKGYLKDRGYLG